MFVIFPPKKETPTMFPNQIITTITLYIPAWDVVTGNATIYRAVLKNVHMNENSISVFQQTGTQIPNNADIFVPADPNVTGREYVTPIEWHNMTLAELDKYWTIDLTQQNHTRIVHGEPSFEFDVFPTTALRQIPQGLSQQFQQINNPQHGSFIHGLRQPRDFNDNRYNLMEMGTAFLRVRV